MKSKLYSYARRESKDQAYNLSSNESFSWIFTLSHWEYFGCKYAKEQ